jgi:hypothetical protein
LCGCHDATDIEEAPVKEGIEVEKMGGEFVEGGAYLSWHHLNYSVFARDGIVKKKELQLLHDVSGFVKPGMMLALMVPRPHLPPSPFLSIVSEELTMLPVM